MAQTTQGDNCAATSSYDLLVVREKDRKSKPGAARHCCVPGCTSDNRYWKSDSPVWFHTFALITKEALLTLLDLTNSRGRKTVRKHGGFMC